jgi:glycosyltransferase involved in cell wall biosynthesis
MPSTEQLTDPEVSIIIPARNEELLLGSCLGSLLSQDGVSFEIIVVNDHSTDRTREIAESFVGPGAPDASSGDSPTSIAVPPTVHVIEAGPLSAGWTGKNNALVSGTAIPRGKWFLFTDADTIHLPGSVARALDEAREHHADMLSYSPEQIAVSFWEMAVLPVVFAELARRYPPSKVSDPASPIAAANGQYVLITREAYAAVGGHTAIADQILEDVALARAVKRSGRKIFFRYAADAVRTRMYRNFAQLREGWTKNLALLFPSPAKLALKMLALWCVPWIALPMAYTYKGLHGWLSVIYAPGFVYLASRLRRANFTWDREILGALVGYPMFAYLLMRSKRAHAKGNISWKGRKYSKSCSPERTMSSHPQQPKPLSFRAQRGT